MEYKDTSAELKALDDTGEGVLRFIRFHQEDKDRDITLPGFVGQQEAVLLAGHNWKSDFPPLGRGTSYEADGATYFRFKLNMDDERAKSWRSWLKMAGALQQVSYGFSPYADSLERWQKDGRAGRYLKPRPDGSPGAQLHEVSFVTVGSGNDQGVLSIKEAPVGLHPSSTPSLALVEPLASRAITPHHHPTDDRVWNAWLQQSRVKATSDRMNYYNALYAVADVVGATERRQFRGLHHFVDDDGEPGPASTRACLELIYNLHKGYFPASEREGIYLHLAAHLRDAGMEAPPLTAPDNYGMPMDMRVQVSAWGVDAVVDDLIGIHEMRSRKGLTLTEARLQQVQDLWQRIDAFCQVLQLKAMDKPYSAQVEEFANHERVRKLHERLEQLADAEAAKTVESHRAAGEEHYRRFVEMQRRFHGGDVPAS